MPSITRTRTRSVTSRTGPGEPFEPELVLMLECARPLAGPQRWPLKGVREIVVGRGGQRTARVHDGTLRVTVADPWMSSTHARVAIGDHWELADAGSKNGCFVNGRQVEAQRVRDGDLVELGGTFFALRRAPAELPWADSPVPGLRTLDPAFGADLDEVARVARSRVPVLVHGPIGAGKELAARAVHELSGRPGPFLAINCGALPASLLESELFGCMRGAYTGAEERPGLLRAAEGGTLLLDEIAELAESSQVALLRVLQEREVVPLGGSRPLPVDIRVVAATHQDLAARVARGAFRADLFSRLNGFLLRLPPLRARREDLGVIIPELLRRHAGDDARVTIDRAAARALLAYAWPRNVRELDNALSTALALAGHGVPGAVPGVMIAPEHLPPVVRMVLAEPGRADASPPAPVAAGAGPTMADRDALRAALDDALRAHAGNITAVARTMGKQRAQIHRWLKQLGLRADDYRADPGGRS